MPHSLRVRLKNLNYKGLLTDRELNRLVNALDTVDVIEDIKAEISQLVDNTEILGGLVDGREVIEIIDKHTKGE